MGDVVSLPIVADWISAIAFDPGQDTGWAWCMFDARLAPLLGTRSCLIQAGEAGTRYGQIDCGSTSDDESEAASTMCRYVQQASEQTRQKSGMPMVRTVVICEGFRLRQRTMSLSLLSPVRLQSKLEQSLYEQNVIHQFFEQQASEISIITDEILLDYGMAVPRHLHCKCHRHANDALRHLILWMRKYVKVVRTTEECFE